MFIFFFNDTATTEIYTLSLHDALPICSRPQQADSQGNGHKQGDKRQTDMDFDLDITDTANRPSAWSHEKPFEDRKSTRLNSSHLVISYAVFCLKKKKSIETFITLTT